MSEYTPSDSEIRTSYLNDNADGPASFSELSDEFDRWLKNLKREIWNDIMTRNPYA
jgi:hypothetical protein